MSDKNLIEWAGMAAAAKAFSDSSNSALRNALASHDAAASLAKTTQIFDRFAGTNQKYVSALADVQKYKSLIDALTPYPGAHRISAGFGSPSGIGGGLRGADTALVKEFGDKLAERDRQLERTKAELAAVQKQAGEKAEKEAEAVRLTKKLEAQLSEARRYAELSHLLARVDESAGHRLLNDEAFRTEFLKSPAQAFVMSIDVRRSTELMLKAHEPELFAVFIVGLTSILKTTILENGGVFDKFTGDGILAFFPEFFSGPDAGYSALKAASECHAGFEVHYRAHRSSFNSVLKDVGLGIGIDYGRVHTTVVDGEYVVVGTPVVYACRMAGADPGVTLLNRPAQDKIAKDYDIKALFDFEETELNLKHEGPTEAYAVRRTERPHTVSQAAWREATLKTPASAASAPEVSSVPPIPAAPAVP